MIMLKTESLGVQFGIFKAVDNVDVEIEKGKLTTIIGPNGAGKTTFFNLLTGLYTPTSGRVIFEGTDITRLPIHKKVDLGLTRTFQILKLFDDLTVSENIRIAVQRRFGQSNRLFAWATSNPEVEAELENVLRRVRLIEYYHAPANSLSHGHRRHLELGLSLATNPKMILLDEPMSGLGMYESGQISEFIRELARDVTVVLVEHHMSVVMAISDRILVLNRGRLIASGTPEEIHDNPLVREAYLGTATVTPQSKGAHHA